MEHEQPSTEKQRVEQEIRRSSVTGEPIPPTAPRIITSWRHGGQSSKLYSFQSCGAVDYDLIDEVGVNYNNPNYSPDDVAQLDVLIDFVHRQPAGADQARRPAHRRD